MFWTQGVQSDDRGTLSGRRALSLELVLLERLGFHPEQNSYTLNKLPAEGDTPPRTVSYAKMRTRMVVDRDQNVAELAASPADPHRHEHLLPFPRSRWELYRWNPEDAVGFVLSVIAVFAVLGFMQALLKIG